MSFYSTTVLADSPIRYYRLNETAYKVADSSGNNRHAAASASGITYGQTSLVGNSDTCMAFDGINGLVATPAFGMPSGSSPTFSMECWFHFVSNPASTQVICHLGDWTGTDGPFIGINSSGQALAGTHTLVGVHGATGLAGAAHYAALTYDGTTFTLYVDGSSVGTFTGSITVAALGVHIANIIGKQFMYVGQAGQVAVYNYKLTATQVSNHFAATGSGYDAAILADTPVGYWKLNDSAGSNTMTDSSTSAQNGTYAAGQGSYPGLLVGDTDTGILTGAFGAALFPTASLPTVNAHWSLEAWIETAGALPVADSTPGIIVQFGNYGTTNQAPMLSIDSSGKPRVDVFNNAAIAAGAISFNARHHIVGTWDGTTLTLYVDGSSAATATPGALNISNGSNAYIGANGPNATVTAFFGIIDEVAVYNTTLSSARVLAHYNAGVSPTNNLTLSGNVVEVESVSAAMQGVTLARPLPEYGLWIRDNSTLEFVDVLNDFILLEAKLNFNGVSALAVQIDPYSIHAGNCLLQNGTDYVNGFVLTRDNNDGNGPQLLFSGPIIDIAADFDATAKPPYSLLITAESDDVVLEDRDCLPVLNYPYNTEVLSDSPLRYYRLDETSGTVATDSSSNHQNGTYNASGVTYNVAPGIDDSDTAVTFDGIAGKVTIPTGSLPAGNAAWTLHCWCNFASLPGSNQILLGIGGGSTNTGAFIALGAGGFFAGDWSSGTTAYSATAGDWHHVAAKWDGTILTLYVDGLPRQTLTPGALAIAYGGAAVGCGPTGATNFFAGSIDEAVIVGAALTDARVLKLYNVGLNRFYEGPAYDSRSGVASTIMLQYIQNNAGNLALPERQTANLVLGSDPLIGGTVDESVRFHNLLATCQNITLRASNEFGFQVRQTMNPSSNYLLFSQYQPRNQQTAAQFSLELGNLVKFSYQATNAVANVAYSGGSGSGTTRPIRHVTHVSSINRTHKKREQFYNDSQYTTTRDLNTQGAAHLTQDRDLVIVGFEAIDTLSCVFLRDYHLGDLISVAIDIPNQPAIVVQDIVRQVNIKLQKGSGASYDQAIQPVIGAPGTAHPLTPGRALNKAVRVTTKRIDQLQNNQ